MSPRNATNAPKGSGQNFKISGKLKESCDMCSSSKVKCNKEKPACGRCRKLGYPCFYSPARRIGRPHPNRRIVSRQSPETRPTSLETSTAFIDRTPLTPEVSKDPASEAEPRQTPFIRGSSGTEAGCGENPLQWLDELYTSPAYAAEWQRPIALYSGITSSYGLNEPFNPDEASLDWHSPLEAPGLSSFTDAIDDDICWMQFMPSDIAEHFVSNDTNPAQGDSAAMNTRYTDSAGFSCSQSPASDSSGPDCVTGAIEILRQLEASQNRVSSTIQGHAVGLDLSKCMQIASSAIDRLTTATVCPCSQKEYVGILIAAVCLEILSVYESFFARHRDTGPLKVTASQLIAAGYDLDIEPLTREFEDLDSKIASTQALGELSRFANLVTQFSSKYETDSRIPSMNALSTLAEFLKFRLRLVTSEAFERGAT